MTTTEVVSVFPPQGTRDYIVPQQFPSATDWVIDADTGHLGIQAGDDEIASFAQGQWQAVMWAAAQR